MAEQPVDSPRLDRPGLIPSSPKRQRTGIEQQTSAAKRTKSRNGCRGCKSRRLKCDEAKPGCLNCERRGQQCPGYARDFKFSDKHERLRFTGELGPQARKRQHSSSTRELISMNVPTTTEASATPRNLQCNDERLGLERQTTEQTIGDAPKEHEPAPDVDRTFSETTLPTMPSETREDEAVSTYGSNHTSAGSASNDFKDPTSTIEEHELDEAQSFRTSDMDESVESIATSPAGMQEIDSSLPAKRRRSSNQLVQRMRSRISSAPIDLSTTLIEYWFTHVCAMWSAYDSKGNPNRQMALNTCFNSEPVFFALQSMSAACLVDSLPHLRPVLASTSGNALAAINRDMEMYYDLNSLPDKTPPTDLLLAIFAMATSLCWTDTSELGIPLVEGAKTILKRHQDAVGGISGEEENNLTHFRHALKYTEMLLHFVNSESIHTDLERMRSKQRKRLHHIMQWESLREVFKAETEASIPPFGPEEETNKNDSPLHPWTGVCPKAQERFSLAMALCRNHRNRRRFNTQSTKALCESLCDIEVARELTRDLIHSEISTSNLMSEKTSPLLQTGDVNTPLAHLLDTAEAYRLAALLQLYLTFHDLEVRLDDTATQSNSPPVDGAEDLSRDEALVTLALLLVDVLQRIPASSNTKCIQPVLYVSAAAGLKFDTPVTADLTVVPLTQWTVEVSSARKFIVSRLTTLLRSLPPKPIVVALNLVKAIWAEYDYGEMGVSGGHWMDVMERTGLQTLFG